jgi:hypothetical protein
MGGYQKQGVRMVDEKFIVEITNFFGIGLSKGFQDELKQKIKDWNSIKREWAIQKIKEIKSCIWKPVLGEIMKMGEDYEDWIDEQKLMEQREKANSRPLSDFVILEEIIKKDPIYLESMHWEIAKMKRILEMDDLSQDYKNYVNEQNLTKQKKITYREFIRKKVAEFLKTKNIQNFGAISGDKWHNEMIDKG